MQNICIFDFYLRIWIYCECQDNVCGATMLPLCRIVYTLDDLQKVKKDKSGHCNTTLPFCSWRMLFVAEEMAGSAGLCYVSCPDKVLTVSRDDWMKS